ncbi:MBL fold metallo-hydrolase [Uliginosibacterium paludis]|uniref:MBL fold metallo-hydrolase n=1 Tax=Uliginosibacterium paludis TaxID=1615952 RepID=A0ABV2CSD4_9RHOO
MTRSTAFLPRFLLMLSLLGLPLAQAAAPLHRQQAPGYYRMLIGKTEVTAIYDGFIELEPGLLKGASAKDVQKLIARMFQTTTPGVQTAVNAFVINTGDKLILVDSGAAACFGPGMGRLLGNLKAAGYEPGQVDAVLLTHLHADHACGLRSADGKAVFPKADVFASKQDADFWLDENAMATAPKSAQGLFRMAQESVAPYVASGRFKTFTPGGTLFGGVSSVAAFGHTPGHTAYLVKAGKERLLLWGDIVHNHASQFVRPDISIEFDVDAAKAIETRQRLFVEAARDQLWIGGAHLPFPGFGHVRKEENGFSWVPVEYAPLPSKK